MLTTAGNNVHAEEILKYLANGLKPMMLTHVKILSFWEIAHYWHDCDPRISKTHQLPLKVRDTLLVLSMTCSKKLYLRAEHDKAFLLELIGRAPRFTARHYRHAFKKAVDNKVFGKRFFSRMFLTRGQLCRWCVDHNESLPSFWFPDNDKSPYSATDDLSDEITVGGRYRVQLLYDDTAKSASEPCQAQRPLVVTVNQNAVKAANAKHARRNGIKDRFINFYQVEGSHYPSKTAAAEYFFDNLATKQEKLLFNNKDTATRTLLDALRSHLKEAKSSK